MTLKTHAIWRYINFFSFLHYNFFDRISSLSWSSLKLLTVTLTGTSTGLSLAKIIYNVYQLIIRRTFHCSHLLPELPTRQCVKRVLYHTLLLHFLISVQSKYGQGIQTVLLTFLWKLFLFYIYVNSFVLYIYFLHCFLFYMCVKSYVFYIYFLHTLGLMFILHGYQHGTAFEGIGKSDYPLRFYSFRQYRFWTLPIHKQWTKSTMFRNMKTPIKMCRYFWVRILCSHKIKTVKYTENAQISVWNHSYCGIQK